MSQSAESRVFILGAGCSGRHVADHLLSKVPEGARIVVQNPDAATVRSRLEAYPCLRGPRVEFDPTRF